MEERDTTDGWLLGMDVQMDWVTGAWRLFWGREKGGNLQLFCLKRLWDKLRMASSHWDEALFTRYNWHVV